MKLEDVLNLRRATEPGTRRAEGGPARMITKVLVVDDSALMRAMLTDIINACEDLRVVAVAADAMRARDAIQTFKPDVLTLDVEMPGTNGLAFLERLMQDNPMPVVMISSYTEAGSQATLRALELGAVDFISKPKHLSHGDMHHYGDEVREKIRAASSARLPVPHAHARHAKPIAGGEIDSRTQQDRFIFIGASTGGTEAIKEVLSHFPAEMPPIMIVQHMPEMFTASFAKRLDGLSRIHVKEAVNGEPIKPGVAYLAPGHSHLLIKRGASGFVCELSQECVVNRHRPSVDVLFHSAAKLVGRQAIGVMLTGMGKDGAAGMLAMRQAGAWNIAQDEASCVVWGMPREATVNGAANEVAPLKEVATHVISRLRAADRRTIGG